MGIICSQTKPTIFKPVRSLDAVWFGAKFKVSSYFIQSGLPSPKDSVQTFIYLAINAMLKTNDMELLKQTGL